MAIDPLRHLDVFDPRQFGRKRVDLIGVGATGSHVAVLLAKLGITNIHVWDQDTVEAHNVANQAYSIRDVGSPKVEALARNVKALTGEDITTHCEFVTGETADLGDVVFLLVDGDRRGIFEGALENNMRTELVVETRMGADNGRVYCLNPNDPAQCERWKKALPKQRPVDPTACGASTPVGPTATCIASLAAWQMVRWFNSLKDAKLAPEFEVIMGMRPLGITVQ